ncbi:TIGR02391 family protein [candidate division KSB1 bacterium]|nr:TIGR02391 family protein [candidate division KSB1 bacterium]
MYFSYQHEISDKLWESISKNYESEDYSGAILDAIFLLSETIRERTDVELDGVSLIGKVFGGSNPVLKVNDFRTESDKNVQKGVENILRGLFQAIRNPRAHEKIEDEKKTCDVLITFIDYLLGLIESSKAKFEIDDFCSRVFDSDFVESEEYAELLVKEIPKNKIFEVLLEIFDRRHLAKPNKYYYIIQAFIKKLNDEQKKEFARIVSNVLKTSDDDNDFRLITTAYQGEDWLKLEISARLRTENKLIKSFEKGLYDSSSNRSKGGALGTWLSSITDNLKLKKQFRYSLIKKLSSDNYEEIEYLMRYFRNGILIFEEEPESSLISAINKRLKKGDSRFYDLVSAEFFFSDSKWLEKIKDNYDNFEEQDLDQTTSEVDEDDLPF